MSKTITLSDESIHLIRSALIDYRDCVKINLNQLGQFMEYSNNPDRIIANWNQFNQQKEIFDDLTFLLEETFPT